MLIRLGTGLLSYRTNNVVQNYRVKTQIKILSCDDFHSGKMKSEIWQLIFSLPVDTDFRSSVPRYISIKVALNFKFGPNVLKIIGYQHVGLFSRLWTTLIEGNTDTLVI